MLRQTRAIVLGMPQMQHSRRKAAVLAPDAGTHEPNNDVGILTAPAAECCVEAVDPIEIVAADREVCSAGATPRTRANTPQRAKGNPHQRQQAIDRAFAARRKP